jgi:hypothetical protein
MPIESFGSEVLGFFVMTTLEGTDRLSALAVAAALNGNRDMAF